MHFSRSTLLIAGALVIAGCTSAPGPGISAAEQPAVTSTPAAELRAGSITVRVQSAETRTTVSVPGVDGPPLEIDGKWVLPRVVVDGPVDGAMPDGSRAVLAEASAARSGMSRFVVVDLKAMTSQLVELAGEFSFDAWSPDGSVVYFIEHRPPAGSGKYVVRAYDRVSATLRPDAVADKRTLGEEMAGLPVARASTRDGRSVATLYVPHPSGSHGAGHEGLGRPHGPFVHLLFAADVTALCVDLPAEVAQGWAVVVKGNVLRISRPNVPRAYAINLDSGELSRTTNTTR